MTSLKCVFQKFHKVAIYDFNENGTNILTCSRYLHFKSEIVEFFGPCDVVLILSGASLNSFLRLEGKNVDTLTESVDILTGNVYGAHTRFDIDTNITRVDYYDSERAANIRRIEMKEYFSS